MPRKISIQKEELIEQALNLVREEGYHALGVRSLARAAGCSTQPVLSHFPTLQALQSAVWQAANEKQGQALFNVEQTSMDDFLFQIARNYVCFALDEPQLFQLIFNSGWNHPLSMKEMITDPELAPILGAIATESQLEEEDVLKMMEICSMYLHGTACLAASGQLVVDLDSFLYSLELLFDGVILRLKENHSGQETQ